MILSDAEILAAMERRDIVIEPYDVEYLHASRADRARMWGMLSARWITAREPVDEPGLELIGRFEEDPDEAYEGSDGPYLYENRRCLPRAFVVDRAVVLAEPDRQAWIAATSSPRWDPTREVLVDSGPDPSPELLAHATVVVTSRPRQVPPEIRAAGVEVVRSDAMADRHPPGGPGLIPLDPPRWGWDRLTLDLPPEAGGRWLVLAETCALYPGWTATVDGTPTSIQRANGAATALWLPAGAARVELNYRTPRLREGLAVTGLVAALALVACLALARSERRSAR